MESTNSINYLSSKIGDYMVEPNNTIKTYKLFRLGSDGKLYPLFISKRTPTPIGVWLEARFLPTEGYAPRGGWHSGLLPIAEHLKKKDGTFSDNRVWAECEVPADVDWQKVVNRNKTKDLQNQIPEGGYYKFPRPFNQGGLWIISGAIKVNRILSWEEVDKIIEGQK